MWSGPIQDRAFIEKVYEHTRNNQSKFGTAPRMLGMLTLAREARTAYLYWQKLTGHRRSCRTHSISLPVVSQATSSAHHPRSKLSRADVPSYTVRRLLHVFRSALLNAGYNVSRSHAAGGSFKTDAPLSVLHDVFRGWIKINPVKMEKIKSGSPAAALNTKEPTCVAADQSVLAHEHICSFVADFTPNPKAKTQTSSVKIVRYQHNPAPNWGPGMRPNKKRRAEEQDS